MRFLINNKNARIIIIVISILLFITSDVMEIFYSYIYSDGLSNLRFLLQFLGFIGILFFFVLVLTVFPPDLTPEERKTRADKKKPLIFMVVLMAMAFFVGNVYLTTKIKNDRYARILREEPT